MDDHVYVPADTNGFRCDAAMDSLEFHEAMIAYEWGKEWKNIFKWRTIKSTKIILALSFLFTPNLC